MAKASSPVKRGAAGGGGASSTAASQSSGSGSRDGSNGAGTGPDDLQLTERTERVESTIVSRENATHAAFAASRTRDFVYAATSHYLHLINDYCDSAPDGSSASSGVSSLLVVVGQPGMGKSALLAHWAAQRRASEEGAHEFIYEHYCGCSFDSVKLSLFLFRLMNQLKITYGLRDFELPRKHDEEKLKFSFARCLEAAVGRTNQRAGGGGASASRRNIVLVLDGIDCLRTEDGGDSLSWLPNSFPCGVRIIVSATHRASLSLLTRTNSEDSSMGSFQSAHTVVRKPVAYDGDDDLIYDTTLPPSDHDSHTLRELRRRRTSFIVVEPLDESSCRAILHLYNTHVRKTALTEDEEDAVVSAPGSSSPLYLRLLVQGQELFDDSRAGKAARRAWVDRVLQTGELHVVYELLMRRWTDILIEDLEEQQQKMLTPYPEPSGEGSPGKLMRRATKRDVVAAANHDQGQGHGRPGLSRTPSMRSTGGAGSQSSVAVDPAEWEALQVALEQRVLLVRHTLSLLAVSRYGLSETDLQRLLGDAVPKAIYQKLLLLLRPHVMQIRRHDCGGSDDVVLFDLSHNQLRLLVRFGFLSDDHLRGCYYKELATYFGGLEASQRRLDELPVQLERCAMWSALQGALVDIKMFQLWWSERNRQEFFSYWMVLRTNCSIHDPVDDFIRSLDEFIIHEAPSAEQLLALCLTITDFLRTWQRIDDSRSSTLTLARPAPPQLNEFMTSLGGISSNASHLSEHEAKRVHAEIDALCIHKDDAYFVRRWLWTQFPLIGIAFESRFLRHSKHAPAPESVTGNAEGSASSSTSAASEGSPSSKKAASNASILPKTLHAKAVKNATIQSSTKRKPSLLFLGPGAKDKETGGNSNSPSASGSFDMLPTSTSDDGAFEFLSTENTEHTVGSVSKCETQVVDLRMKYDKLKFMTKERQAALQTLDSRLLDARAQTRAAGQSASQVDDLLDQIRHINNETVLGRQRSDFYKAILRHCEIHPARDANAIEVTETAVNKMKHEIVELQQKTQVVSYESRLASIESKKLQQVIEDKTSIHNTALERLRWRCELMQRMLKQHRAGNAAKATLAKEEDEEASGTTDNNASSTREDAEGGSGAEDGEGNSRRRPQKQSSTAVEFNRAKDKLLHKKETSLERLRKVDQLKVYVGSPFKDDGVLGALRQVGINKPEEAHLYWQDQQQHAVQLEAEEKSLELRVVEFREKLSSLQTQLVNLKLGGSSVSTNSHANHGADSGTAAVSGTHGNGSASSGGASAAATLGSDQPASTTDGATSSTTHNLKQLEQHLSDALTVTQQKKERAARLKSLSERLHLGLQHVAQILGVAVTQQMESMELADAVEQVVRLYLGDEGHMQSGSSTNLRRKNSVRAMGMANQSGLHAIAPHDTRTTDEKLRYNIRVSKSSQRQMNPYVDGDRVDADDYEDEEENDDCDPEDAARAGWEGAGVDPSKKNTDSVTRRADIKHRSRLEVERKLKTPVVKQSKQDKGKAVTKRQSVVADK